MDKEYLIEKKVEQNIKNLKLINKGDIIITALSGGADSVALLVLLNSLKDKMGFFLEAIHIEHGIRGEESIEDMNFVKELCKQYDIRLYIYEVKAKEYAKKEKLTLEEAARILRYKAFMEEAEKQKYRGNVKIAVAHHKNDQAETVIFNMLRGSGLKGISGIKNVRDNIVRPLLCFDRKEIEEYLNIKKISYRTDSTNNDNDYSRNTIRNVIIPELMKIQPKLVEHICMLAGDAIAASEYFEKEAEKEFARIVSVEGDSFFIKLDEFCKLDKIIKEYLVINILKKKYQRWKDVSRTHIEDVISLYEKNDNKMVNLPKGVVARREEKFIIIESAKRDKLLNNFENNNVSYASHALDVSAGEAENEVYEKLNLNGKTVLKCGIVIECSLIDRENMGDIPNEIYTKWLDYDKISGGLFVRNRKEGDYLCINRDLKKKKLKDYFINEKIPQNERNNILLIADGNHILWILGRRISEYYKVSNETKKILKIDVIGG